ncbi:MAG: FAD-dependent oxidoreductase [Microscillaceae bacterium]|nr:FAD-dependent oxidoreductase [Microscillaceae bacterium]
MIVDPREALAKIPSFLEEKYGVRFQFGQAVTHIEGLHFWAGGKPWAAKQIVVCSGADFETLFPEKFAQKPITKCKLQMMRTLPQPDGWRMGPSLCAGLTLLHYEAFADCPTLPLLRQRIATQMPQYLQWGIHVLVSQNGMGEIILGDTHEYGLHLDPFDKEYLNQWVLDYLEQFAQFPQPLIAERWHGVYAKWPGQSAWVETVAPGISLVNALGGAGMTLSFGLAESQPEKKSYHNIPQFTK